MKKLLGCVKYINLGRNTGSKEVYLNNVQIAYDHTARDVFIVRPITNISLW